MVDLNCKICGGNSFSYAHKGIDRFCQIEGAFDLYRCNGCGLIFIFPFLQQDVLMRYYPDTYYSYSDSERIQKYRNSLLEKLIFYLKHPLKAANCILYSKLLRQKDMTVFKKSFNVLDVGCGDGRYLLEKKRYGCKLFGVDISDKALRKLKDTDPDMNVYCGNLWEAGFSDNLFDIVNVAAVLEHVIDIERLLLEIRRIIKEKGVLRIQVPNASSLTYKVFGRFWMGLDVPRHLYVFSLKNLKLLFKKSGFKVQQYRTVENSYDFVSSTIYVLNSVLQKNRNIMESSNIWDNELLKLLFFPYALFVNALKIGDSIEFVLQKDGKY